MSSISLNGDTSGAILIQAPAVAGSSTLTLPAKTATLGIQGPAFSAYANSVQTLTNGVNTKIAMNTEEFDTDNCYDATTNYRFTPNVAGYYQVSGCIGLAIISTSVSVIPLIYKNGSAVKLGTTAVSSSNSYPYGNISVLIYCNGTTDYLEFYALSAGATVSTWSGSSQNNYFQAFLARGA